MRKYGGLMQNKRYDLIASHSPQGRDQATTMARILLIEDDLDVSGFIRKGLEEHGYQLETADNGEDGLFLASTEAFNAIILDRMLPKIDGIKLLKALRGLGNKTPVLLLSAMASVDDRVDGLQAGADDYLTKPFSFRELQARVSVLLRRPLILAEDHMLQLDDLCVDTLSHKVTRQGHVVELKPTEYRILLFLLQHRGEVISRTLLLEQIWGYHFDPQTNVVDVHISKLRNKLDKPYDKQLIHTVRGAGYKIEG